MWSETTWRTIQAERAIGHDPLNVVCLNCERYVGQAREYEGLEGFPFDIQVECARCVEEREQEEYRRILESEGEDAAEAWAGEHCGQEVA